MFKLCKHFLLLIILTTTSSAFSAQPLDRIVAEVNNQVITESQLDKAFSMVKTQMLQTNTPIPNEKELKNKILNNLINAKLQLEMAERAKLKVSDAQVDKSIADIAAKNHMAMEQMKQAIAQQGIDYADYRHQIREQMIIAAVQREALGPELHITEKEVQTFLKSPQANNTANAEYHLLDILIPIPDNVTPTQVQDIKKQATEITEQWRNGNDLSQTNIQQNDLGWRHITELPREFASIVPSMKINSVAGPIQAPNGFHLLKLVEKRGATRLTAEQAKEAIFQQKFPKILDTWLQKLRSTAYVKIIS